MRVFAFVALVIAVLSGRAAAEPFSYDAARASVAFVATRHVFEDRQNGFVTCAGVIVDEHRLVVPLQCVPPKEEVGCKPAALVSPEAQLVPSDFARWIAEGATCRVTRRIPTADIAVLTMTGALPKSARAATLDVKAPPVGSDVWAIGFPDQVPAVLSRGIVATLLSKVKLDGVPPEFRARLVVTSGAGTGTEGAALFAENGRVIGMALAHSKRLDGGYAIPASEVAAALQP